MGNGRLLSRVLILHSRVGGGHQSAAQALAAALGSAQPGLGVQLADVYVDHASFPVSRFPTYYARLARYHPRLWGLVFSVSNAASSQAAPIRLTSVLRPFLRPGLIRLLELERPDLVVSVLPGVNDLLVEALRSAPQPARFEVVLTDWAAIHRSWIAPGVDHYTAPNETAHQDCLRFGAEPELVDVVGIPLRPQFRADSAPAAGRAATLRGIGLAPDRFTVLAMVGAEGSPRAFANIAALADLPLDAQLVVVCGRNQRLRRQVEALGGGLPRRALGFVDHIADLMRASDLLVTKAGGVTLAEGFACGVPVIVHDVLPGQETGNASYVRARQAAVYAPTGAELRQAVAELANDPDQRAELVRHGNELARPDAAERIASAMLTRLDRVSSERARRAG